MWKVEIERHSINYRGTELVTFNLTIPRIILPELRTHRMLSYNVGSSRAIPSNMIIEQVEGRPFVPEFWGKNKRGMSASEWLDKAAVMENKTDYYMALNAAIDTARSMAARGTHKQIVNRVLEPYMWVCVVVTGTDWDNFFKLRCDAATVEPHLCKLANWMRDELAKSEPKRLKIGEWHLPFINESDLNYSIEYLIKFSTARVARTSYHNHDGSKPDHDKDISTYKRLLRDRHLSCFEHQAQARFTSLNLHTRYYGNFKDWKQQRKFIIGEAG